MFASARGFCLQSPPTHGGKISGLQRHPETGRHAPTHENLGSTETKGFTSHLKPLCWAGWSGLAAGRGKAELEKERVE